MSDSQSVFLVDQAAGFSRRQLAFDLESAYNTFMRILGSGAAAAGAAATPAGA